MFGKNLKYILAVGALAVLTFTNPAVLDAISSGIAYNQQAAVGNSFTQGQGFFGNFFRVEARPAIGLGSTSNQRFMGTTTRMMPPPFQASSTRSIGDMQGNKGNRPDDRRVNPQDVVTLLFKAGLISQDKLAQARTIVENARLGTTTRMMPPPLPPASTTPINSGTGAGEGVL